MSTVGGERLMRMTICGGIMVALAVFLFACSTPPTQPDLYPNRLRVQSSRAWRGRPPRKRSVASGELEFHAGGTLVGNPTSGSAVALPAAEPFTTGTGAGGLPSFPSRRVSSWYFGDRATLLNQVAANAEVDRPLRIDPVDSVLSGRLGERQGGGSVGVRISRRLNARLVRSSPSTTRAESAHWRE